MVHAVGFAPPTVGVAKLATRGHEVPLPPLEGEVVERQRNQRGLYVNRVCKPLSFASLSSF